MSTDPILLHAWRCYLSTARPARERLLEIVGKPGSAEEYERLAGIEATALREWRAAIASIYGAEYASQRVIVNWKCWVGDYRYSVEDLP